MRYKGWVHWPMIGDIGVQLLVGQNGKYVGPRPRCTSNLVCNTKSVEPVLTVDGIKLIPDGCVR